METGSDCVCLYWTILWSFVSEVPGWFPPCGALRCPWMCLMNCHLDRWWRLTVYFWSIVTVFASCGSCLRSAVNTWRMCWIPLLPPYGLVPQALNSLRLLFHKLPVCVWTCVRACVWWLFFFTSCDLAFPHSDLEIWSVHKDLISSLKLVVLTLKS